MRCLFEAARHRRRRVELAAIRGAVHQPLSNGALREARLLPEARELIDRDKKPLELRACRRVRQVPGIFQTADVGAGAAADEVGEILEQGNAFRIDVGGNQRQHERRLFERIGNIVGHGEQAPQLMSLTGSVE